MKWITFGVLFPICILACTIILAVCLAGQAGKRKRGKEKEEDVSYKGRENN